MLVLWCILLDRCNASWVVLSYSRINIYRGIYWVFYLWVVLWRIVYLYWRLIQLGCIHIISRWVLCNVSLSYYGLVCRVVLYLSDILSNLRLLSEILRLVALLSGILYGLIYLWIILSRLICGLNANILSLIFGCWYCWCLVLLRAVVLCLLLSYCSIL